MGSNPVGCALKGHEPSGTFQEPADRDSADQIGGCQPCLGERQVGHDLDSGIHQQNGTHEHQLSKSRLTPDEQAQQAYLLALAAARPDSFQGLYQQLDSFPVDVRQSLVRQSREANQQFYLYAARNKLAELGIYKGKGKSTRLLFRAMASYCRRVATPAFCQQPPTSGYYGEILSYAFRDPPAKAEDCPGLTDILYQAK